MKKHKSLHKIIAVAALLVASVSAPQLAAAKWSKASSGLSYDGVTVKVTDRHQYVGAMFDTYGYATYKNSNPEPVQVNWRCYGVLKKGSKLVCVNDDSFILYPGQERSEVYSYSAGHFTHRDFSTYVVAIEVKKDIKLDYNDQPAVKDGVDASNADEVYERVIKHISKAKTSQQDYTDGLDWLLYTLHTQVGPLWQQIEEMRRQNLDTQSLYQDNAELLEKWRNLKRHMTLFECDGLFTPENEAKYEQLNKEVAEYQS